MSKFNIASVGVVATSFLHLRGPDETLLYHEIEVAGEGDPKIEKRPIGITLYSPGTTQYQNAITRRQNNSTARLMKGRRKVEITTEDRLNDRADFLASITAEFVNFEYDRAPGANGSTLFKAVYADPALGFIADQVEAHGNDYENFMTASPKI